MSVARTLPNVPFMVASSCASDRCAHASSKRRFAQRLYLKKSGSSVVVIAMISFYNLSSSCLALHSVNPPHPGDQVSWMHVAGSLRLLFAYLQTQDRQAV